MNMNIISYISTVPHTKEIYRIESGLCGTSGLFSFKNHTMEEFRDIKGYEGLYQVSNQGRVKSLARYVKNRSGERLVKDKIRAISRRSDGYMYIGLSNIGEKRFNIHPLVAKAFIPNPDNKPCVNHINGIKSDNNVSNLEWATYSENSYHSYHVLGTAVPEPKRGADHPGSLKVTQYTLEGDIVKVWDSGMDASRGMHIDNSSISKCCRGVYSTSGGFKWGYYES